MTEETRVEREMVLIRVEANKETRAEIFRIVDIFRAKVVDVGQKNYMLELTGDQEKITAFIVVIICLAELKNVPIVVKRLVKLSLMKKN